MDKAAIPLLTFVNTVIQVRDGFSRQCKWTCLKISSRTILLAVTFL